jgi:hypothetical protein
VIHGNPLCSAKFIQRRMAERNRAVPVAGGFAEDKDARGVGVVGKTRAHQCAKKEDKP